VLRGCGIGATYAPIVAVDKSPSKPQLALYPYRFAILALPFVKLVYY